MTGGPLRVRILRSSEPCRRAAEGREVELRYYEPERREFVRVKSDLKVHYKYLSHDGGFDHDEVYEGVTQNVSAGGILLVGEIPDLDWIPAMLMERVFLGVNVHLPDAGEPVKALTRIAWIEAVDPESRKCAIGLKFKEMTKEHQDRVFKYIIHSQMP